ncbi:MarR family winged helix-turn-helix transcriptional regulator [Pseudonocardia benzenivorans]
MRLVRLIERAYALHQIEHPDGVERATYVLLVHLVKDGPYRSRALADAVHSDPSTVSRQVAHLVRLGLVERVTDPDDGRAVLLVATDEGVASSPRTGGCATRGSRGCWRTGRRPTATASPTC